MDTAAGGGDVNAGLCGSDSGDVWPRDAPRAVSPGSSTLHRLSVHFKLGRCKRVSPTEKASPRLTALTSIQVSTFCDHSVADKISSQPARFLRHKVDDWEEEGEDPLNIEVLLKSVLIVKPLWRLTWVVISSAVRHWSTRSIFFLDILLKRKLCPSTNNVYKMLVVLGTWRQLVLPGINFS